MRMPNPTVEDFVDPPSVEEGLSTLRSHFASWQQVDGRGKKSLWALLGKAYEFGNQVAENDFARAELVSLVLKDPSVEGSNHWRAEKKHPFDLLLVLLLGLKEETKVTKSQWLRSLKTAQKQNVEPTQEAFFAWMEKIGGVDAALKLGRKPTSATKRTISEMAKDIPDPEPDLENSEPKVIKVPRKFSDDDFPDGFGLVIVKKVDNGDLLPLGTIVNEKQVSRAMQTFLGELARQERSTEREVLKMQNAHDKSVRKAARKKFNADKRAGRYSGDFDEFLEEYKGEHPNVDPLAFAPILRR